MELLKSKVTIDPNYKPSVEMDYMEYFYRAMVFAQTNYHEQLEKISKANFRKLSPTYFYEEYAWTVTCANANPEEVSVFFPELSKNLAPFYNSFWDVNNFPKFEDIEDKLFAINHDEKKVEALYKCANVVNRGIKLFGWEHYKNNFLDCSEKLCALPMIGIHGARNLSRNIGISTEVVSTAQLHKLAVHWGFTDSKALCEAIKSRVALQSRIVEMILWYAAHTFDTTCSNA